MISRPLQTPGAQRDHSDRLFFGFLLLVALAPLPLGGFRPLPWAFNAIAVATLLLGWSITVWSSCRPPAVPVRRVLVPLSAALVVLAWATVQALSGVPVDWVSPQWAEAGAALGGVSLAASISVAPADSLTGVMRTATLVGVFFLAVQLGRSGHRARRFFLFMTAVGVFYAAYGLLMHLGGFDMVLWWDRWAYRDALTSTFVNRNHYASYAGLGLLCALGLLAGEWVPRRGLPWSVWLGERIERHWALMLAVAVIFLALVLTRSRAGLAASAIGVTTLFVALWWAGLIRASARQAWGVVAVFALLFVLVGSGTWERIGAFDLGRIQRDDTAVVTARAIATAPALGHGLGTFPDVFALHRDETLKEAVVWRQAHNDYLENTLELGVPAMLLLLAGVAWPVASTIRGLRARRRNAIYPAIGVAATALVGSHALVDFGLQTQGIGISFAALLGVAYAQSWSSRTD